MVGWIKGVDYPDYMSESALITLKADYLQGNETPKEAIKNIARKVELEIGVDGLYEKVFNYVWNGYIGLSSPIWSNFGRQRGLPISCVTGDTWINTQNGGKMAKDIKVGDLVLTHKNRFKKVTDVIPTVDKDDIWKLKVGTRMTNLYITGNHLVLTNLGWVRVDELNTNKHLIAVNGGIDYDEKDYTIDLKEYTNYKFSIENGLIKKAIESKNTKVLSKNLSDTHVTYYSSPREYVNITEELSWALGVWFAEGSVSVSNKKEPNGIRITVNDKDEAWVAEKWFSIFSSAFNLKGNIYKSEIKRDGKVNSWLTVNLNGKIIGNLFNSFGKGAKEKEIPDWILSLPKNKLEQFLSGMLLGDGTVTKNNANRLTISNPKLLLQIYNIGLKLNKDMSLQMQEKAGALSSTSHVYTVIFRGYSNSISKSSANAGIKFNDGLVYCPIKTLEKTDKKETVYDFTVEEDHSFSCAGVVVHNCFNSHISDSILSFKKKDLEIAIMSQNGGGTSAYLGEVRHRGASISNTSAKAKGVMSPAKMLNNTIEEVSQGGVRRGMLAGYLDFSHNDILDFLEIRDIGNPIQTITTGVVVDDSDVEAIVNGDSKALTTWAKICEMRNNIGVPYIMFKGNVNNHNSTPTPYKGRNILKSSNLCSEICLPSSEKESFVCCLASMNLASYDEWKNTDAVKVAIYILEAVMSEFIRKASNLEGMEDAVRFAINHRALGLGTLGEHTFLQERKIPFVSLMADNYRRSIYSRIKRQAEEASIELADLFGACEVNKQFKIHRRHTTLLAIAPTTTNALISGDVSPGIEPWVSSIFQRKVAKGSFLKKNPTLEKLLRDKEQDTPEIWDSIVNNFGSVQHLEFLTDEEKEVFLTAYEINQYGLIKAASLRQEYICQSQSLNLFVLPNTPAQVRSELYLTAYYYGVKTLYYQRSLSNMREGQDQNAVKEYFNKTVEKAFDASCVACEG